MKTTAKFVLPAATPDGTFTACYSDAGLCGLSFPQDRAASTEVRQQDPAPQTIRGWHQLTLKALSRALEGKPAELPPLDISAGTRFQQQVWQALRRIPSGHTSTYGQIARDVRSPAAVRAVGGACGANPIPVFIPCHRVVSSSGLGGFSGGLRWKRLLLAREGIELDLES